MKKYRINDLFTGWLTGTGIFHYIAAAAGGALPFDISAVALDVDYHGNHSGDKNAAPLVIKLTDSSGALSDANKNQLGALIYGRFGDNWAKRWAALQLEYEPLQNYSMVETESEEGTNTGTVGNVSSLTTTGSRNLTTEDDTNNDTDIYAFDSSTASPSDENTQHSEGSETETTSGSQSGTGTRTDNLANTKDRTLTRSGNIGVTTSQQMLQSELDIRSYDFYKSIYMDVDAVLATPVY